ncbi:MAG: GlsB/YeaQ/YmgE family stress response membrane protein [Oligoflexales bacterium]
MSILSWILFGLIVGAVARLIMPGTKDMGFFLTIVLGVVGSVVGGGITWLVRGAPPDAYDPAGWIMSIVGAVVVLLLYSASRSRRRSLT